MRIGKWSAARAKVCALVLATAALVASAVVPASAQQLLRTIDIGSPPGASVTMAQAVSPNGTVAGSAAFPDGSRSVFIWTESGGMVDIPMPPSHDVRVFAVNDSGVVVGGLLDGSFVRRFFIVSSAGVVVDPAECAGYCDRGGVNASGQAVGTHVSGGMERAFVWSSASGFVNLPITASALAGSRAGAINDAGQITGALYLSNAPNTLNLALWTPSGSGYSVADLGRLSDQTQGHAINASGDIAAMYGDASGNFIKAALWTAGGGLVDLTAGVSNVAYMSAGGITDGSLIGGAVTNTDWSGQAYQYKPGVGLRRLNNPPGITGGSAVSIDPFGLLTGVGSAGGPLHAVAWQSCQSRDVHPAGFDQSRIMAANASSFAVGWVGNSDFTDVRAYAWEFVHPAPPPPTPCDFHESGAPPVTYAWETGEFGACSAACGGGVQTRAVVCMASTGSPAPDASCTDPKPAATQACNTQACVTFDWSVGEFGACQPANGTCGAGTRDRTVTCTGSDGNTYAPSFCTTPQPATSQACSAQPCVTYSWSFGAYGACQPANGVCGAGTQTRSVTCSGSDGQSYDATFCPIPRPEASQSCSSQCSGQQLVGLACPATHPWKNHGAYVACVTRTVLTLVKDGTLTARQGAQLIVVAAKSSIGKHPDRDDRDDDDDDDRDDDDRRKRGRD